jgi:hypothetical protein
VTKAKPIFPGNNACHSGDCPEVRLLRDIVEKLILVSDNSLIVRRYKQEVCGMWPDEAPLTVSSQEGNA